MLRYSDDRASCKSVARRFALLLRQNTGLWSFYIKQHFIIDREVEKVERSRILQSSKCCYFLGRSYTCKDWNDILKRGMNGLSKSIHSPSRHKYPDNVRFNFVMRILTGVSKYTVDKGRATNYIFL